MRTVAASAGSSETLSQVLRRYERDRELVWGRSDCVHFAFDAAAAAGRDARSVIPQYDSEIGALRRLRKWGGLIDFMDAHARKIRAIDARPGDIAYFDIPPIGALGVVVGPFAVFRSSDLGLLRLPLDRLQLWRVA